MAEEQTKAVAINAPPPSTLTWLNSNIIFNVIQIIGLACMSIWFHRKISAVSQQVADLQSRLEEAETAIERHESVLKKVMTLLGKQNRTQTPEVVVPLTPPPRVSQPRVVQEQQPPAVSMLESVIGPALGSIFMNPMSFAPSEQASSQHPVQPKIVEISDKDLDAELKSEIGELTKEEN